MSEMIRFQAERVDLADALHDAECECDDRPDHEATQGVDYSNTASTVVSAGWMPAARCEGAESPQAVSDRLFLRQIAGVVDVRTGGEQWQHEVLHRVGVLARADVRQPATEPHRTNDAPDSEVARLFHEAYERLAPQMGYRTREASAVPWDEVPQANRDLMVATVHEVRAALGASAAPADLPATLASVDDVRRVCEAAGLGQSGSDAWGGCKTAPYVEVEPDASPDTFLVHVDDQDSFDEVATVQAGARGVLLWHAIQAARSTS